MFINKPRNLLDEENIRINHCLYLTSNNTVIKDCLLSNNNPDFLDERIKFVAQLPVFERYTRPINVLSEYGFTYGYEMQFLEQYTNIGDFLLSLQNERVSNLPINIKKAILLKVLECLKKIK